MKNKLPKANKELGQHFLRDQTVITKITNDWVDEADVIVEVGPGPAVLTEFLADHKKPLYLIEKDTRFKERLEEFLSSPENLHLMDALKFDWKNFLKENDLENKKIWLVSNLPYNVGTLLFVQFLEISPIKYMTLMFQKEVGDKTYLGQVKNQMNGLLALSLNYFNSKRLIKVAPGCFTPPPKVDSVVVSYQRKDSPEVSIAQFSRLNKFTRLLFSQRRKQMGSVLKQSYQKESIQLACQKAAVSDTDRAETLSFEQVINLFNHLESQKKI